MEASSVGVAFNHGLDKGFIYHIHLFLTVFVRKIHRLTAYNRWHLGHVCRHGPVQGNIRKWGLGSPAAWSIDAIDKGLNTLLHLGVGQMIRLDKRS